MQWALSAGHLRLVLKDGRKEPLLILLDMIMACERVLRKSSYLSAVCPKVLMDTNNT